MRNFPAGFITEKNRQRGSRPAWILKIIIAGSPVYISDCIVTNFQDPETGSFVSTKAWVTRWGTITEGITGSLGEFSVGEFTVTMAVDLTDSNNIMVLIDNHDIEAERATLFAWYKTGLGQGVTFPGQIVFSGYVKESSFGQNDVDVTLTIQDDTLKLRATVGSIVDQETFPDADPDDIGKLIPVVFGSLEKFPTLAIDAGIKTNLTAGMTAGQTTMNVSDASGFWVGMWCGIDDETVLVASISGSNITITRAQDSTTAATHQRGADIIEIRPNDFAYLIADHPIQSVSKIWGRIGGKLMDITAICTVYTGQSGHEHATYLGRGIVTVPGFITISQAAQLMLNDGIGVSDLLAVMDGTSVSDTIAVSDTIGISDAILVGDNIGISDSIAVSNPTISNASHTHTGETSIGQAATNCPLSPPNGAYTPSGVYASVTFPAVTGTRTAVTYSLTIHRIGIPAGAVQGAGVTILVNGATYISNVAEMQTAANGGSVTYTFSVTGTDMSSNQVDVNINQSSYSNDGVADWTISSASRTVTYNATGGSTTANNTVGGASKTGTIAKTGNASRSGSASKTGSASKSGLATKTGTVTRSGSVTKTGSVTLAGNSVANTLIGDAILVDVVGLAQNTPQSAIAWLLANYAGYAGTVTQAGNYPSGYTLNGAIIDSNSVLYWVNRIAFEFRSFFKFQSGAARLIVRPDSFTAIKTIAPTQIENFTRSKTAYEDIINKIIVRYDRDYTKSKGLAAYNAATPPGINTASITKYGQQQKDEIFCCDFITTAPLALSVRGFFLSWYSSRHWLYMLECYLDQLELEFGDQVGTALRNGMAGIVRESGIAPGNSNMDRVNLKIEL